MPKKEKKTFIHYLPVFGCFSTGLIYLAIGVIAILSFLKIKDGGADESSLIAYLEDYLAGRIFVWIILLGTACYITWRIYESITDPYGYGSKGKGIARRTGIALSTIPDLLIGVSIIQIMLGETKITEDGRPEQLRKMTSSLLQESWGPAVITVTGAIILLTAIVQLFYGITKGYKERLNLEEFSRVKKSLIHSFAWAGYLARGIIVGIIGFFCLKAGIENNGDLVVNTDKAFDFIGDHVSHLLFILVAMSTISYGIFMLLLGANYDPDKD